MQPGACEQEGNETSLLKYIPAYGGNAGKYYIAKGNFVTLAEVFRFGCRNCTCFDLYRT